MASLDPSDIIKHWTPPQNVLLADEYLADIVMNANTVLCEYMRHRRGRNNERTFRNMLKKVIVCVSPLAAQLAANHIMLENKQSNLIIKDAEVGCARTINSLLKVKFHRTKADEENRMLTDFRRRIFAAALSLVQENVFSPAGSCISPLILGNAISSVKKSGESVASEDLQKSYHYYFWGLHGFQRDILHSSMDIVSYGPGFSKAFANPKIVLYRLVKYVFDFIDLSEIIVVAKLPNMLCLDDMNRLHNSSGSAVEWEDGFSLCFWKGINVPRVFITSPSKITSKHLKSLNNVEVRRAASEILGNERFAELLGIVPIDEDMDEKYNPVVLLRSCEKDDIIDNYLYYLCVVCPSTGRKYYIKVPPSNNVWSSLAWTFEKSKNDYDPLIQT